MGSNRIGIITAIIGTGGATQSLLNHLKSFAGGDKDFVVYSPRVTSESMRNEIQKYAEVVVKPFDYINYNVAYQSNIDHFRKVTSSNEGSDFFKQEALEKGICLWHVNNTIFPHLLPLLKETKVPILVHVREQLIADGSEMSKYVISSTISNADGIVGITEMELKVFEEFENKFIVFNPFDFSVVADQKTNKMDLHAIKVGLMGNFNKVKGYLLYLDVIDCFNKRHGVEGVQFRAIGVQERTRTLKALAKRILNREDFNSIFYQTLATMKIPNLKLVYERPDIVDEINDLDIILRLALTKDPWGRDIIEGLAMGKVVLGVGASSPFIEDGINGFLVDSINPDEIVDKMGSVLSIDLDPVRKRARSSIKEKTKFSTYRAALESIYADLIK